MSTPAKAPRIRITADDYGLHKDINAGIIECIRDDLVNAVSVGVCTTGFDVRAIEQLHELKHKNPDLEIGIHLMLTEGTPLLRQQHIGPTDHTFYPNIRHLAVPIMRGSISPLEVLNEWQTQTAKLSSAGFTPLFLTSHQHVHLLPKLMRPVRMLMRENAIPEARSSYQSIGQALALGNPMLLIFQLLARYFAKTNRPSRRTLGVLCSMNFSLKAINHALVCAIQKNEPIEIMVHPAHAKNALRTTFPTWNAMWDKEINELKLLKSRLAELC